MPAVLMNEVPEYDHERARLRSRRMYETDMTSNILTAELRGEMRSDEKWQAVVADKDSKLAENEAEIAWLRAELERR